ncbi:cytochrome b5-like heme/steroid binding domain-containing protein [Cantharellus anzutake]|uniref:cytochrome b5-like heme/steroid binding domain-containing protein n=1 Tax=Cantharellus anzutake TaxID=1750568 RepID=UPI001905467B|nr:cytochrome b5-like heme/steroid binding domain-containing protein [Cantharellus anzutake]KAF8335075.1 cytochrome b5-like heme/steroid binding domain-containing protein [Cantharellus anzutake]
MSAQEEGAVNAPIRPGTRQEPTRKIRDARGNLVTDKSANRPFLASVSIGYREYKVKEEEKIRLTAEKIQRRNEKIAKGQPLGPEDGLEPEPSAASLNLAKIILFLFGAFFFAGWFITGSVLWEYEGKWTKWDTYFPRPQKILSPVELAEFDGTIPGRPVYIAINGEVYDVTASRRNYGRGGNYHNFAGVDATRAFATQCLKGHRTHDLRGLTDAQLRSRDHWIKYFKENPKYPRVGVVFNKPINPSLPLPGPCGQEEPLLPVAGPNPNPSLNEGHSAAKKLTKEL